MAAWWLKAAFATGTLACAFVVFAAVVPWVETIPVLAIAAVAMTIMSLAAFREGRALLREVTPEEISAAETRSADSRSSTPSTPGAVPSKEGHDQ